MGNQKDLNHHSRDQEQNAQHYKPDAPIQKNTPDHKQRRKQYKAAKEQQWFRDF